MKRRTIGWIGSTVALLLVGAFVSQAAAAPAQQSTAVLQTASNATLGTILVNSQGMTLYMLSSEAGNKVTCTATCATAWPPLVLAAGMTSPTIGPGVTAGAVGTVSRPDGTVQVTYNGFPLYTFSGDSAAGQTNGQGIVAFGGTWTVVQVSATAAATPTVTSTSTSSTPSGPLVQVATNATLGPILTNSQGMTLYYNTAESGTTFVCKGGCLGVWPPLQLPAGATSPAGGPGITGTLGVVTRPEGSKQVTYNGEPLYTFAKDTAAGQTNGEGIVAFGGVWHAARVGATPLAAVLAVPLRVKITTTGSTVWGLVHMHFTLGGKRYDRACASSSCTFAVPAGVTIHLSQTPANKATWPFSMWKKVVAGTHRTHVVTSKAISLTLKRGATVTAIYTLA